MPFLTGQGGLDQTGGYFGMMPQPGGMPGQQPGGVQNPGAMQFMHAMMNQPGANFTPQNIPTYGTPFAFGVPPNIQQPTARAPRPGPAPVRRPISSGFGGSDPTTDRVSGAGSER